MRGKFLFIIPARGGSKGVLRKNIRDLAGKPLIAWTIEEAKKSKFADRIILSSDDEEIIQVAKHYGCEVPFIRPKELAQDDTPGIDPVLHAIDKCPGYDYVVLLQPTSPLRTAEDIDGCIQFFLDNHADTCVTVKEVDESPYWMYTKNDEGQLTNLIKQDFLITRRQELPKVYKLNGAVYVAKTERLKQTKSFLSEETVAFVMPKNRSVDIDIEDDFPMCEWIIKRELKVND